MLGLSILSIKATPEMAKAFQAGAREKMLQKADEAIYARRNTAVELERGIKENELNTEIAIEEKRRTVAEEAQPPGARLGAGGGMPTHLTPLPTGDLDELRVA